MFDTLSHRIRGLARQAWALLLRSLTVMAGALRLAGWLFGPIFAAVVSFTLLAFTPQMRDVYRAVLEDTPPLYAEAILGSASLLVLSWCLRVCCRHLAPNASFGLLAAPASGIGRASAIIAAMPLVGLAFGLLGALDRSGASVLPASGASLKIALGAIALLSLAIAISLARRPFLPYSEKLFQRLTTGAAIGFLSLSVVFAGTTSIARFLGPVSLVSLFSVVLSVVLTAASSFSRRRGLPIGAAVLTAAITFSVLNLNDGHEIRTFQSTIRNRAVDRFSLPAGKSSFTTDDFLRLWLQKRGDYADYQNANKPYPIYVIAAQGGGIYAAYHTATFLAAMQDRCPSFAQHIFAISAVSGGSLGAAAFAGLAKISAKNDHVQACQSLEQGGALRDAADRIFGQDLLSPLVGGLLFPDLLQSFLPFRVPSFDRARRLEDAFEGAWDSTQLASRGMLSRSILNFWDLDGPVPALVLNTTAVESGEQVVIPSLPWDIWHERSIRDWLPDGTDMSLKTAAILSARFPWASPAGWLYSRAADEKDKVKAKTHFVDGGYFDNSGTEIAKTIADALRRAASSIGWHERYDVKLIVLSGASPGSHEAALRFSELSAPVRTFLSVRERRSALAQGRAEDETCAMPINFEISTFQSYRSCLDFGYDLPLGWRLSSFARTIISDHTALKGRCWPSDMYDPTIPKDVRFRIPNVCTIMEVMRDLTP
jgi:predicted acylesterase/phospholipase RssA